MAHSANSQEAQTISRNQRPPCTPAWLKSPSLRYQNLTSILQMSMLIVL